MRYHSTTSIAMLARIAGLALGIVGAATAAAAFDLQGHRGARGLAPENTLEGFALALSLGVTTLEMDLGVSADGVVVVRHDSALNPDLARAADGRWLEAPGPALIELPLAAIRRFDVGRIKPGSRYALRFPDQKPADGARIPTLAEVAALAGAAGNDTVRFNLETKLTPDEPTLTLPPEAFAAAVVDAIRAQGIADRATVQSFDWRTLRAIQEIAPEIPTVCLTAEQRWLDNVQRDQPGLSPWTAGLDADDFAGVPDLVAAAGCRIWSPFYGDVSPDGVLRAQDLALEVVVWTVNDPKDMHALMDIGVNGIITDYPDRLRQVMAERGISLPDPTPVTR